MQAIKKFCYKLIPCADENIQPRNPFRASQLLGQSDSVSFYKKNYMIHYLVNKKLKRHLKLKWMK